MKYTGRGERERERERERTKDVLSKNPLAKRYLGSLFIFS